MKYKLQILPAAEKDISDTFDWYEGSRTGLGYEFMLSLDAGFQFILRNPDIHPEKYRHIRTHLIRRFPYKIIYTLGENSISVLAVFHHKRNPARVQERIQGRK